MSIDMPPEAAALASEFLKRNGPEIYSLGKGILKGAADKIKLSQSNSYKKYITAVAEKYSKSKSLFFKSSPVRIYDFYIPLGVTLGKKLKPKVSYSDVINLTNRAVVTGSAGSGKSMLMRHLFLSALKEAKKFRFLLSFET